VLTRLAEDEVYVVRQEVARNPFTPEEVLVLLALTEGPNMARMASDTIRAIQGLRKEEP
jgi:hypothetical protein